MLLFRPTVFLHVYPVYSLFLSPSVTHSPFVFPPLPFPSLLCPLSPLPRSHKIPSRIETDSFPCLFYARHSPHPPFSHRIFAGVFWDTSHGKCSHQCEGKRACPPDVQRPDLGNLLTKGCRNGVDGGSTLEESVRRRR